MMKLKHTLCTSFWFEKCTRVGGNGRKASEENKHESFDFLILSCFTIVMDSNQGKILLKNDNGVA